jgi:hypothetical protein
VAESRVKNPLHFHCELVVKIIRWKKKLPWQDAQTVRPARPQRVKA